MSDTYICPRCNDELEVRADDLRGVMIPYGIDWEAYVAIRCEHCMARAERIHYEKEFPEKERRKKQWDFMKAATDKTYQDFSKFVVNRAFRRYKPINDTVTAVQWTGRNYEEMRMFLGSTSRTNNLVQILSRGEYVIRHGDGKFSVLPEKDFKEKYEEVLK